MPRISFWTIFVLFGIVSRWAEKALEDGKITLSEAAELAESLGPVLGIPVSIEVPAPTLAQSSEPLEEDQPPGPGNEETLTPAQFLEKQQEDEQGGDS